MPKRWFSGNFEAEFDTDSLTDGFNFSVFAEGKWQRRSFRLHNPESVAIDRIIQDVAALSRKYSILNIVALEHRLNSYCARTIKTTGLTIQRAQVKLRVEPEDQIELKRLIRLRARARIDHEIKQLELSELLSFREMLREDPTIAYAQLLLKSPEQALDESVVRSIKEIGEQVATYAPGAAWVRTAQLLDNSFGQLPVDAKAFIIKRFCNVLMEFGMETEANHIMQVHKIFDSSKASNDSDGVLDGAN